MSNNRKTKGASILSVGCLAMLLLFTSGCNKEPDRSPTSLGAGPGMTVGGTEAGSASTNSRQASPSPNPAEGK